MLRFALLVYCFFLLFVCSGGIQGRFARQIDTMLDDGNTQTGTVRVIADGAVNQADATLLAPGNQDQQQFTVCSGFQSRTVHIQARLGGLIHFCSSLSSAAVTASGTPSKTTTSPSSSRVSGAGSSARIPRRRMALTSQPKASRLSPMYSALIPCLLYTSPSPRDQA
eukprot:TRINITY_DN9387_c0_g1_i2.p2 TRINITY_DN9387_c0_g1~~TRINITY_DN9387_c0_g1_i2.p2  ORF type:complete len:167 (-),score=5.06 TRINITY_DN9387_c0_g1_i2:67-567(-)